MARKRLEEAILAGQDIEASSLKAQDDADVISLGSTLDIIQDLQSTRSVSRVYMPLDKYGIYCLSYSPNRQTLAVGFGNGGVSTLRFHNNQRIITEVIHNNRKSLAMMSVKYHRNGELLLAAGAYGEVNCWKINESNVHEPVYALTEEGNEINALDLCSDCSFFATSGKDRHIRLYDTTTLRLYHTITAPDSLAMDEVSIYTGHTKRVFALKFHPQENHLFVTAGWDDCMKLWDKRMARSARKSISGPHVCGSGIDLLGNQILTGSWSARNSLQLWDLRAGCLEKTIPFPHDRQGGEFLYSAKFLNSETVAAGGSGSNITCVFKLKTDELIDVIKSDKSVLAVESHSDGRVLASAGIGGNLYISTAN